MQPRTIVFLVLSSLLNAAICFFSFWSMVFATSPNMDDVTMRVGFYALNAIVVAAIFGTVGPWVFAYKNQRGRAIFLAALPVILVCITILSFLTLDSWLQKTFSN